MCKDPQLAKKLSAAKESQHRFALICKGPKLLGLVLSKTSLEGLTKLKTELGGNAVYKGVCEGSEGALVFTLVADKAPTEDAKLTKFVRKVSGSNSLKARFALLGGGEEKKSGEEDLRQRAERELKENPKYESLSEENDEQRWYKLAMICAKILSGSGEEASDKLRPIYDKACFFAEKERFTDAIKLGKAILKAAPKARMIAALDRDDVGLAVKDFVKGQAEKKRFAELSAGEAVRLNKAGEPQAIDTATAKRRIILLKKKHVQLKRQEKRLAQLEKHGDSKNRKVRAEFDNIRGMIEDGLAVVGGEMLALSAKKGREVKLYDHTKIAKFAGYYQQGASSANVPIHHITGMIDFLESEILYVSLDDKAAALQDDLLKNKVKMAVEIDGKAQEIRIGKTLVINMNHLREPGDAHRLVNLFRRLAATDNGKALLQKLEKAGRRIEVVNPTDPAQSSFASSEVGAKGDEKTRKESSSEKKKRTRLRKELDDRLTAIKKNDIWQSFEKLDTERLRLERSQPDTFDHSERSVKKRAEFQEQIKAINEKIQTMLRNDPEAVKLVRKVRSLEAAAKKFDDSWKQNLDRRDSKVYMATSGERHDERKGFHHAGVTEPLPDDAILFHELTHSLNRAEGREASHLPIDRWFNEDEHSAVAAESEYLEEIGFNWRRDQYDGLLGPVDGPVPKQLGEKRMDALDEHLGKKVTKDDPDLSKLDRDDPDPENLSESGELSESN